MRACSGEPSALRKPSSGPCESAGGLSGGRASPEAAAKVAELEALQKEAAIAKRLAALRDGAKDAASGPAAGKRARAKPRA